VITLAQGAEVTGVFLQYGGIGAIALLALFAVRVLYNRAAADLEYHRARADRLEDELRALNATMREQLIQVVGPATEAIGDALRVLDAAPRRERRQ
jgi:hypothetical protein